MKQAKVKTWIGGLQVQLSLSMSYYVVYINLALMGMMFWHTTAAPVVQPFMPWASFWMFATLMVFIVASVMTLDYKFMYPSRQGFLNRQAYKHENPIVADVKRIEKNLKKMMKEMGIEYENN